MNRFLSQAIPLALTVVVFGAMIALLHGEVFILNLFTPEAIGTKILWQDVLIGMTIYLKTSIDFAIFIGHLMRTHPGMKNRIAIECGTALGNALGTFVILAIWTFFRQVDWLLAIMIILASLVLLSMAEEGLEHAEELKTSSKRALAVSVRGLEKSLLRINRIFAPLLSRILPEIRMNTDKRFGWFGLLFFSSSIPFILGLDDFAGYVPLFSLVHVYGFAVGVFAGHMILNIALFLSPKTTIKLVTQPVIAFLGAIAFVALALWGFYEAVHILIHAYA